MHTREASGRKLQEAASRRDFTATNIAYSVLTGLLLQCLHSQEYTHADAATARKGAST
jgi:hypothetical protein